MEIKLAEALLRRKELQNKVEQLKTINVKDLFVVKAQRRNVSESLDDIVAQVPKISMNQVAAAFDWHARRLRMIDAVIQQANWTATVSVDDTVMDDFKDEQSNEPSYAGIDVTTNKTVAGR